MKEGGRATAAVGLSVETPFPPATPLKQPFFSGEGGIRTHGTDNRTGEVLVSSGEERKERREADAPFLGRGCHGFFVSGVLGVLRRDPWRPSRRRLLTEDLPHLFIVVKLVVRNVELLRKRQQIDIHELGYQTAPPQIS